MMTDDSEFARYLASYLKQREYDLAVPDTLSIQGAYLDREMLEIYIKEFLETLP